MSPIPHTSSVFLYVKDEVEHARGDAKASEVDKLVVDG